MKREDKSIDSFRCGIVGVIGRPNVGKSTLVNALVDHDILITSIHPHTTRRCIRAVDTTTDYQIIYVDTPGIHKPRGLLSERMNDFAYDALEGSDIVLGVFDGSSDIGPGDRHIAEALSSLDNVYLVLNKCDSEKSLADVARRAQEISTLTPRAQHIFIVSAFTKKNIHLLKSQIIKSLNISPALFDSNSQHDMTDEQLVSELLRESLIRMLREELPQSIGVSVVENKDKQGIKREFEAVIAVSKKSHKPIVISQSGTMLKNAGIRARKRAESFFGESIILTTRVQVDKDWQSRETNIDEYL